MKLAHDMCRPESTSSNWKSFLDKEKNRLYYENSETGETQWQHPMIGYYKGAIFMERGGYTQLLANDQASPPTEEEISGMAAYFGVKPSENAYIREVARMAISAPLPPGWTEVEKEIVEDGVTDTIILFKYGDMLVATFRDPDTGKTLNMHPLDQYFGELRDRRRKELKKRKKVVNAVSAVAAMAKMGGVKTSEGGQQAQEAPEPEPEPEPEFDDHAAPPVPVSSTPAEAPSPFNPRDATSVVVSIDATEKQEKPLWKVGGTNWLQLDNPLECLDRRFLSDKKALEVDSTFYVDGVSPESQGTQELYKNYVETSVKSVALGQCKSCLILGWGKNVRGASMPTRNSPDEIGCLALESLLQPRNANGSPVQSVKASLIQISDQNAKDLIGNKTVRGELTGEKELNLQAIGVSEEEVRNPQELDALLERARSQQDAEGSVMLSLRLESSARNQGNGGIVQIAEIFDTGKQDNSANIITAAVGTQLTKGTAEDYAVSEDSLLTKLAQSNASKEGKLVVISRVDQSASNVDASYRTVSVAANLVEAIKRVDEEIKMGHLEAAGMIAGIEILKTTVMSLKYEAASSNVELDQYSHMMDDLCGRLERLSAKTYTPEELKRFDLKESSKGSSANSKAQFERILDVLKNFANDGSEGSEQLKLYASQLSELSEELDRCRKSEEALRKQLNDHQSSSGENVNNSGEYAENLKLMEAEVSSLKTSDQDKGKRLESYASQVSELSEQLEAWKKEKEDLEKTLDSYKSSSGGKEEKIDQYSRKVAEMTAKISSLEASDREKRQQLESYNSQVSELSGELEAYKKGKEDLQQALHEYKGLNEGTTGQIEEYTKKVETMRARIRSLEATEQDKEEKLKSYASQVSDLNEELERCKKRKEELKKTMEEYKVTNEGKADKIGEYAEQLEAMKAKVLSLETSDKEKDDRLKTCQEELHKLRDSLEHQAGTAEKLKGYKDEIARLSSDLTKMASAMGENESKAAGLRKQRDELLSQVEELNRKNAESRKTVDELKSKVESSCTDLSDRVEETAALKEESSKLSQSLKELRENHRKTLGELKDSQHTIEDMEQRMQELTACGNKFKEFGDKCKSEIANLQKEVEELKTSERQKDSALASGKELSEKLESTESKVSELQKDKSILLDRVEGLTGEPQGDIHDDMPPPPPGLVVPTVEVRTGRKIKPEDALSSIVRIVRVGRPAATTFENESSAANRLGMLDTGPLSPSETVALVRELRSERNELRRKDRVWREEVAQLRKKVRIADDTARNTSSEDVDIENLASKLEQMISASAPINLTPMERIKVGVEAASLMNDEMLSLQRQHSSLALLLRQEERKVGDKERELRSLKKTVVASQGGKPCEPCCSCESRKSTLEQEREDLKEQLKEWLAIVGKKGDEVVGSAALRVARDARLQNQETEERLSVIEADRNKWKQLYEQRAPYCDRKGAKDTKGSFLATNLHKWKSAPMPKMKSLDAGKLSARSQKKTLPPLDNIASETSTSRQHDTVKAKPSFDCRPVPVEVKKRVQRMEDRVMKEPALGKMHSLDSNEQAADALLMADPRDVDIANLKMRLVRAEMERSNIAAKAAAEKREAQISVQHAARSLEQAQQLTEQLKTVMSVTADRQDSQDLVKYASGVLDGLLKRTGRLQTQ
ncbi:hypothetical protein BSKO_07380 [Bryopsis sp. KO-2023]|nr:hypothetical protein BSKO_07380 [Bryopsis sp. KO-2023]